MPKNKKITLDSLAGMIKREFDGLHQKMGEGFTKVDKELQEIKNKISSLERRVIYIEDVITKHTNEIKGIKITLSNHSKELKEIKKDLKELKLQKEPLEERVAFLEKRVAQLEAKVI